MVTDEDIPDSLIYTYNMLIDTYGKAGELKQVSDTLA